jgi:hypothetical protein
MARPRTARHPIDGHLLAAITKRVGARVIAQGAFALNTAIWIVILGSRLDDVTFGQVAVVVASANLGAGICRSALADPLFVGASVHTLAVRLAVRSVGFLVFLAGCLSVAGADGLREVSSILVATSFVPFASYDIKRVAALSVGDPRTVARAESATFVLLLLVSLALPTTVDLGLACSAVMLSSSVVGFLLVPKASTSKSRPASTKEIVTYVSDYLLAGGTFALFLVIASNTWGAEVAGQFRLGQAFAGPITTLNIAAWLAAQQLAKSPGFEGLRDRGLKVLQTTLTAASLAYLLGVCLLTASPFAGLMGALPVTLLVVAARSVDTLTLTPALVIRHSTWPQLALWSRAIGSSLLLLAIPLVGGEWTSTSVALAFVSTSALAVPSWYCSSTLRSRRPVKGS